MNADWEFIDITAYGMNHPTYICQIVQYQQPFDWDSKHKGISVISDSATIQQLQHFCSLSD